VWRELRIGARARYGRSGTPPAGLGSAFQRSTRASASSRSSRPVHRAALARPLDLDFPGVGPIPGLLLLLVVGPKRWARVRIRHPSFMPARAASVNQLRWQAYATEVLGRAGATLAWRKAAVIHRRTVGLFSKSASRRMSKCHCKIRLQLHSNRRGGGGSSVRKEAPPLVVKNKPWLPNFLRFFAVRLDGRTRLNLTADRERGDLARAAAEIFAAGRVCSVGNRVAAMQCCYSVCRVPDVGSASRTRRTTQMPTRTKQKKALKAKAKRASFEKEPWYAAAVARFSAARPNLMK
jgi:hypothetical protein